MLPADYTFTAADAGAHSCCLVRPWPSPSRYPQPRPSPRRESQRECRCRQHAGGSRAVARGKGVGADSFGYVASSRPTPPSTGMTTSTVSSSILSKSVPQSTSERSSSGSWCSSLNKHLRRKNEELLLAKAVTAVG